MTFTTNIFIFGIFPIFILVYYLLHNKPNLRMVLLFVFNIIFYIFGGVESLILLIIICLLTWLLCKLLITKHSKTLFVISCIILLLPLIVCKYTGFIVNNLNTIFNVPFITPEIILPIGISFYTFEAISLISDVYNNKISNIKLFNVCLYLTFFPTITSGPIVIYSDFINGRIDNNLNHPNTFGKNVELFVIGLGKKALIADKIAIIADFYFDAIAAGNTMSTLGLWLGSIAYSLQLYFDFSGYSDMARAIAGFLGFNIPINFNYPYLASNIQDFWRRWHISLSTWFKDYVYIPLGGNRCSCLRHIFNLFVVWLLTGIWHGADWSFILWGLGYSTLLVLEKYFKPLSKIGKHWFGHIYTLFFVSFLWIPFRSNNIYTSFNYIKGMFIFKSGIEEMAIGFIPIIIIGIILCLPWNNWLKSIKDKRIYTIIKSISILLIAILSICAVLNSSYSPYIYGNF